MNRLNFSKRYANPTRGVAAPHVSFAPGKTYFDPRPEAAALANRSLRKRQASSLGAARQHGVRQPSLARISIEGDAS